MNSISRYFLPANQWKSNQLKLAGDEAHHCTRVLRSKIGDIIEVFDGEGRHARSKIVSLNKEGVELSLITQPKLSKKPNGIHLIQAIPKGGNMELIIQKAVELGIASIQPIITQNTIVRPEQINKKQVKWQRIALESCKQCGQNYLPTIYPAKHFIDWISIKQTAELNIVAALLPESLSFNSLLREKPLSASCLIGPEGDFSDDEYQQILTAGFLPVSLGNIVLRVETATLYCLSILKHELSRS